MAFGIPTILCWPVCAQSATPGPIADYERASGGRIGVYAVNVESGAKLSWRADERFIMCSTYKASLAAFVLSRVDRGQDDLASLVPYTKSDTLDLWAPVANANLAKGAVSVEEMCKAAVELSDGACANLLLARVGGPSALTAYWRSIGDAASRLDHYEPLADRSPSGGPWDSTTPIAIARTLQKIVLGNLLSDRSRALLTGWLVGCKTGDNRLRAGLPRNWVIGNKTGHSGRDMAGDMAVVWPDPTTPIVIAVFTRGGKPTEKLFDKAFAEIGSLVSATLA